MKILAVLIPSNLLKWAVYSECPLFPKADVQTNENGMKLGAAFGHKRTLGFRARPMVIASLSVNRLLHTDAANNAKVHRRPSAKNQHTASCTK